MSTEAQLPRDVNQFIKAFDEMKTKGLFPIAYIFAESVEKSGQRCAMVVSDSCFLKLVNDPEMKQLFFEIRSTFKTDGDFQAFIADIVTKAVSQYIKHDVLSRPGGSAVIVPMKDDFRNVN